MDNRLSVRSQNRDVWAYVMVAVALLRLLSIQVYLLDHNFQCDFTAYWSASRAVLLGLNPYYHVLRSSQGVLFPQTEFLYPPIVASLLSPLGQLSYITAKTVWGCLQLLSLVTVTFLMARIVWPNRLLWACALLLLATALFFPVLQEFERGQIDWLTLLFAVFAAWLWTDRGNSVGAGICLALAALFKLPTIFLLAVPFAFRDVRFVGSTVITLATLTLLSCIWNGVDINHAYWLTYLPQIVSNSVLPAHDPGGSPFPPAVQPTTDYVVWQGHSYYFLGEFLTGSGSITMVLRHALGKQLTSILVLSGFLVSFLSIIAATRATQKPSKSEERSRKLLLWSFAMLTVLLFNRMTWSMNYIWLLFCVPILISQTLLRRSHVRGHLSETSLILTGIGIAAISAGMWDLPIPRGRTHSFEERFLYVRVSLGGIILYITALYLILTERRRLALRNLDILQTRRV